MCKPFDNDTGIHDKSEATFIGRENAGILIPFQSLRYTSKFKDMGRHAEQEHNDVWGIHIEWFKQAPKSFRLRDDEFRSFDGKFWLNEICSCAIEGIPGEEGTFSWTAMANLMNTGPATVEDRTESIREQQAQKLAEL